jgi:hemolysin D
MNEIMSAQRNQTLSELALARRRVDSFEQEIVKLKRQSAEQVLTAPVDGIVQQLMVHTVGGVVSPAEHLMVIVPDTRELMAEVMISNKDIGFVYAGQDAVIKLETFLFTRYGVIDGRVENVSPDAITDQSLGLVYAARVSLDKTSMMIDGREVRLAPGMAATVEVKIGKRRIIEFILSPLMRAAQESLRER